jgi:hypothetical protein
MDEIKLNPNFDWKKVGEKFLIAALEILIAGGIAYWQQNVYWLAILPALEALRNFLKNYWTC